MNTFQPTADQTKCLTELQEFVKSNKFAYTLTGYAGSGKTTLMRIFYNWLENQGLSILGIAPTHKAKRVLDDALNKGRFVPCIGMTVAGFLGKVPKHGYVGSKNFRASESKKILEFDIILVDECSMLADSDVDEILEYVIKYKKKVLFIGDKAQIPNPSQTYKYNKDGTISKRDSKCFQLPTSNLDKIIRQSDTNPILNVYTALRKNLLKEPKLKYEDNFKNGEGLRYYNDQNEFIKKISKKISMNKDNIHLYRVIAYTNETVNFYNTHIRKILGYKKDMVNGEILMGYNNVGFPDLSIENGQEYIVDSITRTEKYEIKLGRKTLNNIVGDIVKITSDLSKYIFMPDISDPKNYEMLMLLQGLARRVNARGSSKMDYINYMRLKNQLIFMENIYEFDGIIMNETLFKSKHPLLFNKTTKYITEGKKIKSHKRVDEFQIKYPDILNNRVSDNKIISNSEKLADMFQIIEKDIDYGYAITAHKSQGSTYHTVFIDEDDFDKVCNRWNYDYDAEENGTKEKNQLKYVAYTRPTHMAIVLKT